MLRPNGAAAGPSASPRPDARRTSSPWRLRTTASGECLHCSAADYQEKTRRENSALTFEELKSTIDQTLDLGTTCVVLTGGEPLLYERIYDLVAAVDKTPAASVPSSPTASVLLEHTVARLKTGGSLRRVRQPGHFDPERTKHPPPGAPGLPRRHYRG